MRNRLRAQDDELDGQHYVTVNGRTSFKVNDAWGSKEATLRRLVSRLDGVSPGALTLARLPPGVEFADFDPSTDIGEFIQCAGSQERMVIEIRILTDPGVYGLFVVGKIGAQSENETETVRWSGHPISARPSEIWSGREAAEILVAYMNSGKVGQEIVLRERVLK